MTPRRKKLLTFGWIAITLAIWTEPIATVAFQVFASVSASRVCASDSQCHTVPAVTSDTFTLNAATQTLTNKTITAPTLTFIGVGSGCSTPADAVAKFCGQYYAPLVADGNTGTTKTIDFNAGNEHYATMTGNVTFTFSNPVDGGRYVLLLNSGAGGFTVTWPGTVKWPGGVAPTLSSAAAKVDLCTFQYVNTTTSYYAACSPGY